jgi:DNA (cytosine-5)-methyltransferase 1
MTVNIHLFGGPGGWETGERLAGGTTPTVGFDISVDACRTAVAAGHARVRADLHVLPPGVVRGEVDGVVGSPTCRPWAISNVTRSGLGDPRGGLIHVPLRWVLEHRPRWTAWEITPLALPVFEQHAETLRGAGYSVWTGILQAERFGVASTRRRAILTARRDGLPATEPTPTHDEPATMGAVLGVDDGRVLVSNYGTAGNPRNRGRRRLDQPAFTVTGKCGRNRWEWPDGTSRNLTVDEAAQLQGFPAGYPWFGGSISRQQQVGDAVPPPMAAAILRPLLAPALAVAA